MNKGFAETAKALRLRLWRNKYVLLIILVGALLLLLPSSPREGGEQAAEQPAGEPFSLREAEERLADILSETDGAGRVSVMLSVKGGTEHIVAVDEEYSESDGDTEASSKTVIVSNGSSNEEAVVLKSVFPEYTGALVVAEGAGSSSVRLKLTEAVSSVTGLGADKITVVKMK